MLLLREILAPGAISTLFQPILEVGATGLKPLVMECLSRGPASTNAANAGVMFEYARLKHAEPEVDRACLSVALKTLGTVKCVERFSLNVFAATLARDPDFSTWIAHEMEGLNLNPSNFIFEIVEHGEAGDADAFHASLLILRRLGCKIALDDVGLAHSNLQRIIECCPDFLKLDLCIIRNCHRDTRRQSLLRALVMLANDLGCRLIAEGIEQTEEFDQVYSCGINLVQGFLFSKPGAAQDFSAAWQAPVTTVPVSNRNIAFAKESGV